MQPVTSVKVLDSPLMLPVRRAHLCVACICCRIFARLSDFKLGSVSVVGKDQLEGGTYTHTFRNGGTKELPVLPSDHFGLLLKLDLVVDVHSRDNR